jgi:NAD(P)-dependent dehydrogenase (short-subunit alcohol dehydrogenase family)
MQFSKYDRKIALVTGGSSKLGSKITERLLQEGWFVIIHYNDNANLMLELSAKFNKKEYNFVTCQADLSNPSSVNKNFDKLYGEYGYPNLIINNAAFFVNDNFYDLTLNNLERHLNVNLISPLILINALVKSTKDNNSYAGARIINILDYCVNAYPENKFISYAVSKAAMAEATKLMALGLAPKFVVNAIAPGPFIMDPKEDENRYNKAVTNNPLNYKVRLEDVLQLLDFLISVNGITGQIINIDGGRFLKRMDYST